MNILCRDAGSPSHPTQVMSVGSTSLINPPERIFILSACKFLLLIIAAAQKLKIPVYEYSNIKDWKQLNKRRLNDV